MKQACFRVLGTLIGAVAMTACSGAQPSELFDSDGGGSSLPDATADVVPPPPPQDAATDSRPPPPKDSGPPPIDSGPKTSPVSCESVGPCTAPTDVCCRTQTGFMSYKYACSPGAACNANGTLAIPCDDANDCAVLGFPGQVCCAELAPSGQSLVTTKVLCKPANQCTLQSMPQSVIVCDPKDLTACTGGQTCQLSSQTLPGYYICRN